jgi:DNA modification methylase
MSVPLPVADELADHFMVTDPPYGVEYDPSWRGRRRVSSGRLVEGKVLNDVWAKQHFTLSRGDYHWKRECCWYAVREGKTSHWQGDSTQTTIWELSSGNSFGSRRREQSWGHGTQKPVEYMRRPILNNSRPGQLVYDPFLGSGASLIAAEMTGRSCCGLEISPSYVDVILRRWQAFGRSAIHRASGQSFDERAASQDRDRSGSADG